MASFPTQCVTYFTLTLFRVAKINVPVCAGARDEIGVPTATAGETPASVGLSLTDFEPIHENLGWVIEARGVARGAAWGDAVGVALANHLGPL
jgi:hypothetical protein